MARAAVDRGIVSMEAVLDTKCTQYFEHLWTENDANLGRGCRYQAAVASLHPCVDNGRRYMVATHLRSSIATFASRSAHLLGRGPAWAPDGIRVFRTIKLMDDDASLVNVLAKASSKTCIQRCDQRRRGR